MRDFDPAYDGFGSIAAEYIETTIVHVRFAPKADKQQIASLRPLCANTGLMHCSKEPIAKCSSTRRSADDHAGRLLFGVLYSPLVPLIAGKPPGLRSGP